MCDEKEEILDSRFWILVIRNVQLGAVRAVNFYIQNQNTQCPKTPLTPSLSPKGRGGTNERRTSNVQHRMLNEKTNIG